MELIERLIEFVKESNLSSKYDTPDFVIAAFLNSALEGFLSSVKARDAYHYDKIGRKVGESVSETLEYIARKKEIVLKISQEAGSCGDREDGCHYGGVYDAYVEIERMLKGQPFSEVVEE